MKILHLDSNHPLLIEQLNTLGFENHEDYSSSKEQVLKKIDQYVGIVLRSRFSIDKDFIDCATKLKFIGRVGAGLENIDCDYAEQKGIALIAAPEGNSTAVGEHSLALLLALFNKIIKADQEVRNGVWLREENRGFEVDGKTIGLIGYGNMGKAFAKKLRGFDVNLICYDLKPDVGDAHCQQVSLEELQARAQVLSLHIPQNESTKNLVNTAFIHKFTHPFWLINTARGSAVVTEDLVAALKTGKILGAGLDVLEYEKSSFEQLFSSKEIPEAFAYLIAAKNVVLSPHVAGWTQESKVKLAQTIVDKIKEKFC